VGFLMAFFGIDFTADGTGTDLRSGLWRLNIAAGEQGRGYGPAPRSGPLLRKSAAAAAAA